MSLIFRMRILLIFGLILTVGCSPKVIKMDQAAKELLNQVPQMTAIHYESDDFHVPPHALGGMFGAIGATIAVIAAHSQAEDVVSKFHIEDPIVRIKEEFMGKFGKKFSNIRLSQISEALEDDDISGLKNEFGDQKIFDFQTVSWGIIKAKYGFSTPPAFQTGRNVKYFARARLINVAEEKVLWQGICDLKDEATFEVANLEEIVHGKENFLNKKIQNLASRCIGTMIEQFFSANASS